MLYKTTPLRSLLNTLIGLLLGLLSLPFLPFSLPSQSFFLPYNLLSLLSIISCLLFSLLSGSLFLYLLFGLYLSKGNPLYRLPTATTRTRAISSSDDCSSTAIYNSTALGRSIALGAGIGLSLGNGRVLSGTGYGDSV